MQEIDFPIELVIGEDCSTDGTRNIVKELAEKYPNEIKTLLPDKNLGGRDNFRQVIAACSGEYIAILEGDDYWTSSHKLQRQVDFLERFPEYAICFHNACKVFEDGSRESKSYCRVNQKIISTLEDLIVTNFIPTCSVVFRRGLFKEFPDWYDNLRIGDWPLHIFNAQHGKIRYLNEVMGVYREHSGGLWSSAIDTENYKEIIKMLDYVNAYLGFKYEKQIKTSKSEWYYRLAAAYADSGDIVNAEVYLKKCFVESPLYNRIHGTKRSQMLLRIYTPRLYRLAQTVKSCIRPATSS